MAISQKSRLRELSKMNLNSEYEVKTVEILKNIPIKTGIVQFETTTPTGAAILVANAHEFTQKKLQLLIQLNLIQKIDAIFAKLQCLV